MKKVDYTDPAILAIAKEGIDRTITEVIDPERHVIANLVGLSTSNTSKMCVVDSSDNDTTAMHLATTCKQLADILHSPISPLDTVMQMKMGELQKTYGSLYIEKNGEEEKIKKILQHAPTSVSALQSALHSDFLLYLLGLDAIRGSLTTMINEPKYLSYIAHKKQKVFSFTYIVNKVEDFFDQNDGISAIQFLDELGGEISLDQWNKVRDMSNTREKTLNLIWEEAVKKYKSLV